MMRGQGGWLWCARQPSVVMACAKGVTRRPGSETPVLHQLKILLWLKQRADESVLEVGRAGSPVLINKCPSASGSVSRAIVCHFLYLRGLILLLRCTNIDAFLFWQCISKSVKAKATAKYRRLSHAVFSHSAIHCELQRALRRSAFTLVVCIWGTFCWCTSLSPPSNLEVQMWTSSQQEAVLAVLLGSEMYRHVWNNMERAGVGGVDESLLKQSSKLEKEKKKICVLTQCPKPSADASLQTLKFSSFFLSFVLIFMPYIMELWFIEIYLYSLGFGPNSGSPNSVLTQARWPLWLLVWMRFAYLFRGGFLGAKPDNPAIPCILARELI